MEEFFFCLTIKTKSSPAIEGRLSAETVLAAMRKTRDQLVRRAGTFTSGDGSFFVGRRGWMSVNKRPYWFVIVNDWMYWFKSELDSVGSSPAALAAQLSTFCGNVLMR